MFISDDHAGLRPGRAAFYGDVPWLRCPFHIQQNALATILRNAITDEGTCGSKDILNTPDVHYVLERGQAKLCEGQGGCNETCGVDPNSYTSIHDRHVIT